MHRGDWPGHCNAELLREVQKLQHSICKVLRVQDVLRQVEGEEGEF